MPPGCAETSGRQCWCPSLWHLGWVEQQSPWLIRLMRRARPGGTSGTAVCPQPCRLPLLPSRLSLAAPFTAGACPTGFKSINQDDVGAECLKLKVGTWGLPQHPGACALPLALLSIARCIASAHADALAAQCSALTFPTCPSPAARHGHRRSLPGDPALRRLPGCHGGVQQVRAARSSRLGWACIQHPTMRRIWVGCPLTQALLWPAASGGLL